MKRLVDLEDPDDEIVRLLIRAGANHQPAPESKLRLMTALGAGSAVWLSASKVLAWLGPKGGKVALGMTVVGAAAGSAYLMASPPAPIAAAPTVAAPIATPIAAAPVVAAPLVLPVEPLPASATQADPHTPPRAMSRRRRAPRPEPARVASDEARAASLTEETTWVDRLRLAVERHDRPAFERLLHQYGELFPDGQLRPEVDRLRISNR